MLYILKKWSMIAFSVAVLTSAPHVSLRSAVPVADFSEIVSPLLPAVVNISSTSEIKREKKTEITGSGPIGIPLEDLFRRFLEEGSDGPRPRKSTSLGSGFIYAQEGKSAFVVTCSHVVESADEVKVTLHDGTEIKAEIVGRDSRTDLALLKIQTDKKLTTAEWGESSKAKAGQWVIAVGNPFGLSSTVTVGVVSTTGRDISGRARAQSVADYIDGYIQTDAAINMGSSGGPMFTADGRVLGISTAIFSPNGGNIGIGFAIPSDLAKGVIKQLKEHGKTRRGWLGVQIQEISDEIAESLGLGPKGRGALVGQVNIGGPGHKAGLKNGDVLLKFGGQEIKNSRMLPRMVGETDIGKKVPLELLREGKTLTVEIVVGEFEQAEKEGLIANDSLERVGKGQESRTLGMVFKGITPAVREKYNLPEGARGLLITGIDGESEALERGLRPGDMILEGMTAGTRQSFATPEEFKAFIGNAQKANRKQVLLLVNRGNRGTGYIPLPIDEKLKK